MNKNHDQPNTSRDNTGRKWLGDNGSGESCLKHQLPRVLPNFNVGVWGHSSIGIFICWFSFLYLHQSFEWHCWTNSVIWNFKYKCNIPVSLKSKILYLYLFKQMANLRWYILHIFFLCTVILKAIKYLNPTFLTSTMQDWWHA